MQLIWGYAEFVVKKSSSLTRAKSEIPLFVSSSTEPLIDPLYEGTSYCVAMEDWATAVGMSELHTTAGMGCDGTPPIGLMPIPSSENTASCFRLHTTPPGKDSGSFCCIM